MNARTPIRRIVGFSIIAAAMVTPTLAADVNLTSDGKVPGQPFQVLQQQISDLRARLDNLPPPGNQNASFFSKQFQQIAGERFGLTILGLNLEARCNNGFAELAITNPGSEEVFGVLHRIVPAGDNLVIFPISVLPGGTTALGIPFSPILDNLHFGPVEGKSVMLVTRAGFGTDGTGLTRCSWYLWAAAGSQ